MLKKIRSAASKHKLISGIIVIIVIIAGYFGFGYIFGSKTQTTYATSTATTGTITTSVSGSGQVAAASTINLQFQASGILVYLPVKNGQTVNAGQLIAQLDTTNAEKTIRDAKANLDSAQISLQKLEGASSLGTPQNKQDAIDALNQDYQSGYNTVSSVFIDLPTIMTNLQSTIYGNNFNNYQANIDFYTSTAYTYDSTATQFKDSLVKSYQTALTEFNKNFSDYKNTTRASDNIAISAMINETYNTTKDIAQSIKDTNNLIQFYINTLAIYNIKPNSIANTQLATSNSDSSKTNGAITSLLNIENTINKDTAAVTNSSLDIQSAQLSVKNAQNSLQDAKDNLANYYIYAPFSGVLGKISAQLGSSTSSGTSIATLLTTQKICTIPLNEVDVSKVQVGQNVVLTFDALPDLTVAGKVATIDPVGTVTQGVVTYNVQINFATQDSRVKSGMSITAQIITNVKQDVLLVPNAAVKTQGPTKYVQILVNDIPQTKIVTVGLSNDTNTEINSGINSGDKVVTQTITGTGAGAPTSTSRTGASTVRIPGISGGFGGGFRGN